MSGERKQPRWTEPFLLALVRTGEVREAAKWAGVDFTTAYARRKKYADFADAWDGALEAHRSLVARAEAAALAALEAAGKKDGEEERSLDTLGTNGGEEERSLDMLGTNGSGARLSPGQPGRLDPSTIASAGNGCPPQAMLGEELKVKRVNPARWTEAREGRFFDELVASANVRRAAAAAGVSSQAVYARRAKSAVFRRRWDQALANGRAAIEMGLVAEAKRSMDPDEMDLPTPEPRVSVSEAIKITQMNQGSGAGGGRGRGGAGWGAPAAFDDDEAEVHEQAMEELRERLTRKINALRERMLRREGWTLDEAFDHVVPPGWIRDPDYVPKPKE